jgi:hypothetical protein
VLLQALRFSIGAFLRVFAPFIRLGLYLLIFLSMMSTVSVLISSQIPHAWAFLGLGLAFLAAMVVAAFDWVMRFFDPYG